MNLWNPRIMVPLALAALNEREGGVRRKKQGLSKQTKQFLAITLLTIYGCLALGVLAISALGFFLMMLI